jgi:hypothetical protein
LRWLIIWLLVVAVVVAHSSVVVEPEGKSSPAQMKP